MTQIIDRERRSNSNLQRNRFIELSSELGAPISPRKKIYGGRKYMIF